MDLNYKLKESIPSNSFKIIELYNKIHSGQLSPSPNFQRNLVWKKQHKYEFIKTILMNFPFPEVYIASIAMDVKTLLSQEVVVDGQQRLTTIVDYIKGENDFKNQNKLISFENLDIDAKRQFLNYPVSVKDLKDIEMSNIKEIFQRINSTNYALNSNETLNAQFGDGEFAMFAKQLVDKNLEVSEAITDVIISDEERNFVIDFLFEHNVFKENDIKRMFDSQYIMLITSTILDGKYFGRNNRINSYLEQYNSEFANFHEPLQKFINSLKIINNLKLAKESYWFNKANLFTLIIEFQNLKFEEINFDKLEYYLLDLEEKVDIYFDGSEDQMEILSNDEKRYFEVARQGSHELAAREHRAKVIKDIVLKSLFDENEKTEIKSTTTKTVEGDQVLIIPTKTGLSKNIIDATSVVRNFLKDKGIHNYENQELGQDNKVKLEGVFVSDNSEMPTTISLYRSNGRGDYRIWFTGLGDFAQADDKLIITYQEGIIKIYNLRNHSILKE
ncbi:DUF262 domain-containing protein [Chryseobacterium sp. KACC 21268]|nr:DUF262 domain-containing protein [Chryseobacterium sp. KACC 21268]